MYQRALLEKEQGLCAPHREVFKVANAGGVADVCQNVRDPIYMHPRAVSSGL